MSTCKSGLQSWIAFILNMTESTRSASFARTQSLSMESIRIWRGRRDANSMEYARFDQSTMHPTPSIHYCCHHQKMAPSRKQTPCWTKNHDEDLLQRFWPGLRTIVLLLYCPILKMQYKYIAILQIDNTIFCNTLIKQYNILQYVIWTIQYIAIL